MKTLSSIGRAGRPVSFASLGQALIAGFLLLLVVALPARALDGDFRPLETVVGDTGLDSSSPVLETIERPGNLQILRVRFPEYGVYELVRGDTRYIATEFGGCGCSGGIGEPLAPIWMHMLESTPGETVVFEKAEFDWVDREVKGLYYPTQKFTVEGELPKEFVKSQDFYERTGDVYDGFRASVGPVVRVWKQTYVPIHLIPIRYFPKEGRLGFVKEARIHLRRIHRQTDKGAVERRRKAHPGYMVIAPERFLPALEPFLDHKRKTHPDLQVATIESLGGTVQAIDAAIEKAGSRGCEYFLLAGHTTIIPAAPVQYRSLTGPDCFDGDSVYRNHEDDGMPAYKVGRFPAVTEEELKAVVDKTLRRLKNPGLYQSKLALAAHEQDAPAGYQWNVQNIVRTVLPGSKIRLRPQLLFAAPKDKGGTGAKLADLMDALKGGLGLLFYRGHGDVRSLASESFDNFGNSYGHWSALSAPVPPVFYSVACLTGRLTKEDGQRAYGLCENLLTTPGNGMAAAVASVIESPTIPNNIFAWYLMNYTYAEPKGTLGEVFNEAMKATLQFGIVGRDNSAEYKEISAIYNLYGDPEMPAVTVPGRR